MIPLALVAGLWLGGHPRLLPGFARDVFVGDEDTRVVAEAIDRIEADFYRPIPRGQLVDAAVEGAVGTLRDRFSAYFDPREYRDFRETADSRFSGVGLAVRGDRRGLRITRVYDKSPAARAGLRVGDVVTRAGRRSLAGMPEDASTALIKGPAGSEVRLTIRRGARSFSRTVTRATIAVPVVQRRSREVGGRRVGVVALESFSSGAHAEVYAAVRAAQRGGARGLVLDLRGNPGGLVKEAQLVASAFLTDGPIVTTRGRNVEEDTLQATGDPVAPRLPLVVLVDRNTASAAEIVSGALQDRDRARVVGRSTFGKGVFQEVVPLANGGALDLTVGRYFTPDGRNLGGTGVVPDIQASDDPASPADEALGAALRALAPRLS